MMHFIKREQVCEILKIAPSTSYRILGSIVTGGGFLTDTGVVDLLNSCRYGGQSLISDLPSDLCTMKEMSERFNIPERTLKNWVYRREVRMPPHYRITKSTIRFRLSTFEPWIMQMMRKRNAG